MFDKDRQRNPDSRRERRFWQLYDENGGDRNSDFRHSTYYHSYFHNYSERYRLTGRGRKCLERVYEGVVYQADLPGCKSGMSKLVLAVLYLAAAGLFVWGMSVESEWYTVLPAAVAIIGFVLWAPVILEYVLRGKQMTEFEYRCTHGRQVWISQGMAVLMALCAVLKVCSCVLNQEGGFAEQQASFFAVLGAAALAELMNLLERRIPYVEIKNPNRAGDDSVLIQ